MFGKGALMEEYKVDAAIQTNSTSSSLYSKSYSMAGFGRGAVLINVGAMTATGDCVHVKLLGGDSTTAPASMSSITNATVDIGSSSTKGTVYGAAVARIYCLGSAITTALRTITLNGITLAGGSAATYATASTAVGGTAVVGFVGAGAASVVAHGLCTAIKAATVLSNLSATYGATGSTAPYVELAAANPGATVVNVACTAQTTAGNDTGGFYVQSQISQGIISFNAADIMSSASSFTNFCVRVNSTGSSTIPVAITVIRDGNIRPDFQGVLHKKDLNTSSAI